MNPNIATYLWPGQTHVGPGAAGLVGQEATALQAKRAFVIADPGVVAAGLVEPVTDSLQEAGLSYVVYEEIVPNPDIASVDAAGQAYRQSEADLIVGVGGGSGLDTAKAVQLLVSGPAEASIADYTRMRGEKARPAPLRSQLPPLIAIPTTAGTGSEVTPWAVLTDPDQQLKIGVGGAYLLPTVALVDPELTLTLPPHLTAATGMDALSHLIEAYVSTNNNPVLDPLILHGIELVGRSLRPAVALGSNRAARQDMAQASMLGGIGISSNWLGACHSLAHQLSSFADVHHGLAIAIMLPHQMAYSLIGNLERYAQIGQALAPSPDVPGSLNQQAERAVTAVQDLMADIGLPNQLREVGVTEAMIPGMAKNAYQRDLNWMSNPRSVSEADMETLFREAF